MIGGFDPGHRYRRRAAEQRRRFLTQMALLAAISALAFWLGQEQVRSSELACRAQLESFATEKQAAIDALTTLKAEMQSAATRQSQTQTQCEAGTSLTADQRMLLDLIRARLEKGLHAERLASVIRAARPPSNCVAEQARQMLVVVPDYKGPESKITVADGKLQLFASGQAAVARDGKAQPWFDPSKPVRLEVSGEAGTSEKTGALPLQHSHFHGGKEYRLHLAGEQKSFVKVSVETCDFP